MKKFLKLTAFFTSVIFIISLLLLSIGFALSQGVKLDLDKLKKRDTKAIICFSNGEEIEPTQNQSYVCLDEIPNHVINALIAIEDKRFYKHSGIDLKSILRALKNNLLSKNVKQGGSTITQQLIKNTYLSGERTLSRKLKEMRLALEIERKLNKDQILEAYLNTVYFGEGAYGIENASLKFFGKNARLLSIEEGATLVACLKAPSYYNPYKNIERATQRRDLVLKEMFEQGYLNIEEYKIAKNTEIILDFDNNYETNNTLYDEILQEALSILKVYDTSDLNEYKILTNINKELINCMPIISDYGLKNDFSIIITQNKTGKVIGYYSTVGSIKRCPASASKPWLIYAPAIEENLISPATKILDEQTSFDGYKPSNYNDKYYGYVNCKESLEKSLNVPTVKICSMLGCEKVKNYAEKLQITYSNNDLSVALGNLSGGITLKQLSDAYSVFTNEGVYRQSCFIDKIINSKGKIIYTSNQIGVPVFSNSTAFLINDSLMACAKTGTANKLKDLDFDVCAKTGTNGTEEGNLDAYCIAYTTEHTIAVWIGNADGGLMSNSITGGNYPTQIAKDVLKQLYKTKRPNKFEPPTSVKEVVINKEYYQNDCKIYLHEGEEKDGLKFWFKSDFNISKMPKHNELPIIKSYKITCNYCNIEINCETDKGVYYKIYDCDNNEIFDSLHNKNFCFTAPKEGEYLFSIKPYKMVDGQNIFGEEIKLPSILVEGKSDILDKSWWEDD